jgi:DNA recombination protein RmuC
MQSFNLDLTTLTPTAELYFVVGVAAVAGLAIGSLLQYLIGRVTRVRLEAEIAIREAQIMNEEARAGEREAAMASAQDTLAHAFSELAHESLAKNSETFLQLAGQKFQVHQEQAKAELGQRQQAVETLVKPIQDALTKTNEQILQIEKSRLEAYGSITTQLSAMHSGQESLRLETNKLVSSLRQPNVRGRWGELTLKRLAELAGMVDRCDFAEQVHVKGTGGDPASRPDMIVHLPEDGQLVIDVKTPLDSYLDAVSATDEDSRKAYLEAHARSMSEHVKKLASKAYFEQFERSPEFVILFVPGDQFLSAALDVKPDLLDEALRNKVLLVTPTSLVALLKVVAYGWMQFKLAENAEEIRDLAVELHKRLGIFTGHLAAVGKKLDDSVSSYNSAIASLETRVMPNMRKIRELGADSGKEGGQPQSIDITTRELKLIADELNPDNDPGNDPANDNGSVDSTPDRPAAQ